MPTSPTLDDRDTCCGFVQQTVHEARVKKSAAGTKPKPWIVRKLMIPFSAGLMVYAAYVYIGRFCLDMIKRQPHAGGSRATGVVLLIIFSILLLWIIWAYVKVVVTPPGFARDYVPKTNRPMFPDPPRPSYSTYYYDPEQQRRQTATYDYAAHAFASVVDSPTSDDNSYDGQAQFVLGGPPYEHIDMHPVRFQKQQPHPSIASSYHRTSGSTSGGTIERLQKRPALHLLGGGEAEENEDEDEAAPRTEDDEQESISPSVAGGAGEGEKERRFSRTRSVLRRDQKPTVYVSRRPPQTPVLLPAHRYCGVDEIVKPYRTHHCRACGTCVLKYDHHCPWIGQCVGARNYKFFFNFVQAGTFYTIYMLVTLLPYTIKHALADPGSIDPQCIAVIVLTGIFGLFMLSLGIAHVRLIWQGQTTVESMQLRAQTDREERALNKAYGFCGVVDKRRMRKEWEKEWGNIDMEGNIWWLGSGRAGWEDVMGTNVWGWFLPIGRSENDGLVYPVNPRFDTEGRWRRRAEWPKELQL